MILRMFLWGSDAHGAEVSVCIAGFRYQSDKTANCDHVIAPLSATICSFSI
jgi:hypothetical protein